MYVERDNDQVVITDRGETYGYLSRGTDDTYDVALLNEEQARSICARHGVDVDGTKDHELLPRISRKLGETDDRKTEHRHDLVSESRLPGFRVSEDHHSCGPHKTISSNVAGGTGRSAARALRNAPDRVRVRRTQTQ